MNKKDCENLGCILSSGESKDEIIEKIFVLDSRIKDEFIAFEEVHGRSEAVDELYIELMTERYGHGWCLKKAVTKEISKDIMIEARKTVYGDDYHPSLFK